MKSTEAFTFECEHCGKPNKIKLTVYGAGGAGPGMPTVGTGDGPGATVRYVVGTGGGGNSGVEPDIKRPPHETT